MGESGAPRAPVPVGGNIQPPSRVTYVPPSSPERDQVQPAATALAPGHGAELMAPLTQALAEDDPGRKDMLMDIATEELSHLEVIGTIIAMLNKGAKGRLAERAGRPEEAAAHRRQGQMLLSNDAAWVGLNLQVKSKAKKERINRLGVHRFLRVPREFPIMGDCGAFSYVTARTAVKVSTSALRSWPSTGPK